MTTPLWQGWSTDRRHVNLNRIIWAMASADQNGFLPASRPLADDLGITDVDPFCELRQNFGLLNADDTFDGDTWSMRGRAVATEFLQHRPGSMPRRPYARRAVLSYLGMVQATLERPRQLDSIILEPHVWCYGTQFREDELVDATRNLQERGFVSVIGSTPDGRTRGNPFDPAERARLGLGFPSIHMMSVGLTSRGETCIERYDADPDHMETPMSSGDHISIGAIHSTGNTSVGGTNVNQHSTHNVVTVQQTAIDLAAILKSIRAQGGIAAEDVVEAEQVSAELERASTPEAAHGAVSRAQGFFHRLAALAQPAAAALMTAAGNYAAVRLGMS